MRAMGKPEFGMLGSLPMEVRPKGGGCTVCPDPAGCCPAQMLGAIAAGHSGVIDARGSLKTEQTHGFCFEVGFVGR